MAIKKVLTIILISIITIAVFSSFSIVQAVDLENAINTTQQFTNNGKSNIINYESLYGVMSFLFNLVMIIAIIVAIISGIIIGMRILLGSVNERADAKALVVPYLIISVLMALGLTMWKFAISAISSFI